MKNQVSILIVDDSPDDLTILDHILRRDGYATITTRSGQEALDIIESDRPHLVLLDILLPGMSGYEVCRIIRQNRHTALLPVIMVTALAQERILGIEAGAVDFLVKPINREE